MAARYRIGNHAARRVHRQRRDRLPRSQSRTSPGPQLEDSGDPPGHIKDEAHGKNWNAKPSFPGRGRRCEALTSRYRSQPPVARMIGACPPCSVVQVSLATSNMVGATMAQRPAAEPRAPNAQGSRPFWPAAS